MDMFEVGDGAFQEAVAQLIADEFVGRGSPPMAAVLMLIRLGAFVEVSDSLVRKLVAHSVSCGATERDSLLRELRSAPQGLGALATAIEVGMRAAITASAPATPVAEQPADSNEGKFLPLSQSNRWAAQRRYYQEASLGAWIGPNAAVPFRISSNPFVSARYTQRIAEAVASHLLLTQGAKASLMERGMRVAVVELAAGHGLLSLLLVQEMRRLTLATRIAKLIQQKSELVAIDVTVIATDCHEEALGSLAALPWVQEMLNPKAGSSKAGRCWLDLAVIAGAGTGTGTGTAETQQVVQIARSGLKHPAPASWLAKGVGVGTGEGWDVVVMVAQYGLDSMPADLFVLPESGPEFATGKGEGEGAVLELGVWQRNDRGQPRRSKKRRLNQQPGSVSVPVHESGPEPWAQEREDEGEGEARGRESGWTLRTAEAGVGGDDRSSFIDWLRRSSLRKGQGQRQGQGQGQGQGQLVFPMPVGALAQFRAVGRAFAPLQLGHGQRVCLLAGDYWLSADDKLAWGLDLGRGCGGVSPPLRLNTARVALPWISPQPHIAALPVEALSVAWALHRVWAGAGAIDKVGPEFVSVPGMSGSKFACLELNIGCSRGQGQGIAEVAAPTMCPTFPPLFGPNELMVLVELLGGLRIESNSGGQETRAARVLGAMRGTIERAEHDLQLLLAWRWTVLRGLKLLAASGADAAGTSTWLRLMRQCVYRQQSTAGGCVSKGEVRRLRLQLLQWLVAMTGAWAHSRREVNVEAMHAALAVLGLGLGAEVVGDGVGLGVETQPTVMTRAYKEERDLVRLMLLRTGSHAGADEAGTNQDQAQDQDEDQDQGQYGEKRERAWLKVRRALSDN